MKKNIFLLSMFLVPFVQPVAADTHANLDTSEIFSGQDVKVAVLSNAEMQRTQGAFLNFADFSDILNNQVGSATAISNGLIAVSTAISNNIAVNTVINAPVNIAPITINVGQWRYSNH